MKENVQLATLNSEIQREKINFPRLKIFVPV